jgi:hypothetical protein
MPYQLASRPQPVQGSHEPPSLAFIRLQEPALEEEQGISLELPIVLQTTQSTSSTSSSDTYNEPP